MPSWTRLDRRARSTAAALVGVVAVVGSLLVGPAAVTAAVGAGGARAAAAAQGTAPSGVVQRDPRDLVRTTHRRALRDQSATSGAPALRTPAGHGAGPVAAVLGTVLLLGALGVGARVLPAPAAAPRRRTASTRRDRAPPVLVAA